MRGRPVPRSRHHPTTGRFASVDPLLTLSNPQSGNGYTYSADDPLTYSDPSGLEPLLSECAHADSPLCANFGYGAITPQNHEDLPNLNLDVVRACKWRESCFHGEWAVAAKKSAHATPALVNAIRHEYREEPLTPRQVLDLGMQFTGISDTIDCVKKPTWGDCADAILGLASDVAVAGKLGKLGKLGEVGDVGADAKVEETGISAADASALDYATSSAKLDHIFAGKHNFDPLVQQFGSREEVIQQFLTGLKGLTPAAGTFEQQIVVGGQKVIVRGAVVDGITKIGTAFTP
ncbi:hypothetical protein [Amycolatopsis pithecellobii]|uniref:RHS repeat-associated core domain-containing protein n=1 Tax=Amycolatopsis pithecellobii TaxID=664692 RepID=A0A6N7YST9_9PSEU|nr:hypothetical protein [Amycolatopsis pithecellobii]MTD56095.1 hypothetical protein [Amycolatopsis pithecellobii]